MPRDIRNGDTVDTDDYGYVRVMDENYTAQELLVRVTMMDGREVETTVWADTVRALSPQELFRAATEGWLPKRPFGK